MENLERTGYRFDGWFVDEARTKRINPGGKLPGSVTLYD
ncbi:InlB B-repeat-containing protein, partial [Ileibacterium valens]